MKVQQSNRLTLALISTTILWNQELEKIPMTTDSKQLRVVFLPFMAHGHMIPITEMARRFARQGAKSMIITTPLNAPLFSDKILQDVQQLGLQIRTHIVEFPSAEAGLPEGCENISTVIKYPEADDLFFKFIKSMDLFQQPVEELLEQWQPDCIVADFVFHWATESAHRLGIPRLYFNGTGSFAVCLYNCIRRHQPYKSVESDSEPFLIPGGLPHEIRFTKLQLPPYWKDEEQRFNKLLEPMDAAEVKSYGTVINSFHELEPGYPEYFRKVMGRRAWFLGPLSLCNKDENSVDKVERGGAPFAIDEHKCLTWLDSKEPNSVLYICFGSEANISNAQLREIAAALRESGQSFIWVVKRGAKEEKKEEWLPEEFEERTKGRGLVIWGWAPQLLILGHGAIGAFMTHCGWNSTLEGVTAGVPMVTWPLQSEQFTNEKLVTDVLKIAVGVGAKEWSRNETRNGIIGREDVQSAVARVMVGAEAEEMRGRVKQLQEKAVMANKEGGASHSDFKSLLEELTSIRDNKVTACPT